VLHVLSNKGLKLPVQVLQKYMHIFFSSADWPAVLIRVVKEAFSPMYSYGLTSVLDKAQATVCE
jgi:hypothetical protein